MTVRNESNLDDTTSGAYVQRWASLKNKSGISNVFDVDIVSGRMAGDTTVVAPPTYQILVLCATATAHTATRLAVAGKCYRSRSRLSSCSIGIRLGLDLVRRYMTEDATLWRRATIMA